MLRQRLGAACRRGVRGLARFPGLVDIALALDLAYAAAAFGFLRLRWRRGIDDRRQHMMARHSRAPCPDRHLAGDSSATATDKSAMWRAPEGLRCPDKERKCAP